MRAGRRPVRTASPLASPLHTTMLNSLKTLFDAIRPLSETEMAVQEQQVLQLAVAVLFVEVMRADASPADSARAAAATALRERFDLDEAALARLMAEAARTSREATDYFEFTSRINASLDMDQKVRMIEHMWQVAYADGDLDAIENHTMWKISDLLYIPHGAYVNAKIRARDAAQRQPGAAAAAAAAAAASGSRPISA